MRKIKLSAISDLHGNLPNPDIFEGGDVLCITGDIVPSEWQSNAIKSVSWFCHKFIPWTDKLPYKKVLVIFGNHDFFGEQIGPLNNNDAATVMQLLMPGIIRSEHKIEILMDSEYKYMGFSFYGTSWCPELKDWAFYGDHDKLVTEYGKIPDNTDILLTHCPPRIARVGMVCQPGWNYMSDFGCQELADAIDKKNIKWVFCGHVHSGSHYPTLFNNTNIVNVSLLDENYKVSYPVFNVEITK